MTDPRRFSLDSQKGEFIRFTEIIFHQALAPIGWTATADNDKLIRIVTSVGADGGTNSITSSVLTTGNESAHTHTVDDHATHVHTGSGGLNQSNAGLGASAIYGETTDTLDNTGTNTTTLSHTVNAGSAHNHAMDPDFAYTECIIASKD